jgi:predicted metal-dependent phosphoesterase TrpH
MEHAIKSVIADFHSHTRYSKDSLTNIRDVLNVCQRRGIDRLVITDHNTISGALIAQQTDPERVIVGEEIKTTRGELLAIYVREEVLPDLPPLEAIARLRDQGAFISVSHPFDIGRSGHWELADLLQIAHLVDAVEIFNSRCGRAVYNTRAQEFAHQHKLLGTAGSDAHSLIEIGRATLCLPIFHNADTLSQSLQRAQLNGTLSAPWVHISSRYAVWKKSLEMSSSSP